jgi:hypothetical protein
MGDYTKFHFGFYENFNRIYKKWSPHFSKTFA